MRISVIFDNLGPYHIARLAALAVLCDLTAIEIRGRSLDYAWDPAATTIFRRHTLAEPTPTALCQALDQAKPEVVFIPGWSSPAALAALGWCRRTGIPAIIMSASQRIDLPISKSNALRMSTHPPGHVVMAAWRQSRRKQGGFME